MGRFSKKATDFTDGSRLSRADHLLVELDEQLIHAGAADWITKVFGIYIVREDAWAQVGFAGDDRTTVVLHLWPRAGGRDALSALRRWLLLPREHRPRILDVSWFTQRAA